MGKHILSHTLARTWTYTTEITPSLFASHQHMLPITMSGADYITQYGTVDDMQSRIMPDLMYPIRAATLFPVHENYRVQVATELLRACQHHTAHTHDTTTAHATTRTHVLTLVGELLLQSHAGYSAMGLGCDTTDTMVTQLMALGPEHGIYGE